MHEAQRHPGCTHLVLIIGHTRCRPHPWPGGVEGPTGVVHVPVRPGVHLAVLGNIKFEVADRYILHKIVGKGSYGAVAYVHLALERSQPPPPLPHLSLAFIVHPVHLPFSACVMFQHDAA